MKLVLQRDGEELPLSVDREGELYRIQVGERTYHVDVAAAGDGLQSLLVDGAQHEVSIRLDAESRPGEPQRWRVAGRDGDEAVAISDPLSHLARAARTAAGGAAPERVDAYMPGRVVAVLAEEGTQVEAGAGVLVLEAMKMENEIRAERAGRIKKLFVEAGQAVEGGDPLFEIE